MRLLKRDKSGQFATTYEFSRTLFNPQDIPPRYAILSHRWGQDEVTFEHLKNGTEQTGAGYKKLEFCGEQATSDGLLYFWIDTCCIDRSSSAELSEAINSMYNWYEMFQRCYAYLDDVCSSEDLRVEGSRFRKSEWFTRGWTLQELVAPTEVVFFDANWREIGNKASLANVVAQIPRVGERILSSSIYADEISIAEKMSWAAGRQTSREEDRA